MVGIEKFYSFQGLVIARIQFQCCLQFAARNKVQPKAVWVCLTSLQIFVQDTAQGQAETETACYSGAFTATKCLSTMVAGADMVKIFPAALGGPRYILNLKMVYPQIQLIPSGGINLQDASEFIKCGACAISGAREFVNDEMVQQHGFEWITARTAEFIRVVEEARKSTYRLP